MSENEVPSRTRFVADRQSAAPPSFSLNLSRPHHRRPRCFDRRRCRSPRLLAVVHAAARLCARSVEYPSVLLAEHPLPRLQQLHVQLHGRQPQLLLCRLVGPHENRMINFNESTCSLTRLLRWDLERSFVRPSCAILVCHYQQCPDNIVEYRVWKLTRLCGATHWWRGPRGTDFRALESSLDSLLRSRCKVS